MSSMTLLGVGGGASGPALLAAGEYYIAGSDTTATPHEGQGWTLTTALDDGAADDTTTGVTGASGSVTVLHVYAAPFTIGTWSQTVSYRGTMAMTMAYYDAGAWVPLADSNGSLWGTHVGFSSESRIADPGATSVQYLRAIFTESNQASGQTQCTDSRPAV
jgi:hypothetical protein